jgi:predicted enzyme related to lactoylglutathione lyase
MTMLSAFDAAGRRRSPATLPGYHAGRPPRNKGMRYPADPPTVEEMVAVMRHAADDRHGWRVRAMIVVLWRAGLRIQEALALAEHDLDQRRGSVRLATIDLERARSFYADLIGCEYETDEGGYISIMNAGRLNGGMRELAERERGIPPSWLPYFTVERAEDAARRAGELGGRRPVPITETRVGRFTVLADPQGAAFALFEGQTDP